MTHRARHIALAFGLLALWLQLLSPGLAMSAQFRGSVPGATICHGGSHDGHGDPSTPHTPACEHCVLCHAVATGPLPDGRPVFTLFDYPVSSPLRWIAVAAPNRHVEPGRDAQPRGPPILV